MYHIITHKRYAEEKMTNEKTKKLSEKSTFCHNRVSKYINCDEFSTIRGELRESVGSVCEIHSVKDVILRGAGEKIKSSPNMLNEKYILRWTCDNKDDVVLIKECTKGSKVKAITEKINYETAARIIDRSTKWLCTSLSPLIRELGVKMTTERLRPDSVMSFERESFLIENRLRITADHGIQMCDYDEKEGIEQHSRLVEPVDNSVCLLQINYDRVIPEHISSLIGIKAN